MRRPLILNVIKYIVYTFFLQFLIFSLKAQTYCIPAPSDCSNAGGNYRIDSVGFSNIHHTSDCSANGYADFTSSVQSGVIQAGSYVRLSVKVGGVKEKGVTVGIDFNHNGTFDKNEVVYLGQSTSLVSDLVRIPYEALTGNTRMRVRVFNSGAAIDLCRTIAIGETEDYSLNITAPARPGLHFTFYINQLNTSGLNDGSSWVNAFTELSSAMRYAEGRDTIKVAAGIYKPGTAPSSTFKIKDSIIILGGYPKTEHPADADRNFASNQTILSGEIGKPTSRNDNVLKIVTAFNYQNDCGNFILDGFILEDAISSAIYSLYVPGGTVRNCVFRNNKSGGEGSAMFLENSNLVVSNCYIFSNTSGNIYANQSSVLFIKKSNVTFSNCVLANNFASNSSVFHAMESVGQIINCTITNNNDLSSLYAESNSTVNVANSIFYNNINSKSIDSSEIGVNNSAIDLNNTITQVYNYGNKGLLSVDPKFIDTANVIGADNLFFTADDGLQLLNPCSPGINAGLNYSANGIVIDILGHQRVFGPQADLGAFEVQSALLPTPKILYVNKLATGKNDGSSWANAFTDLQRALYYCSDTIKVAAGNYYPSLKNPEISFWLQNKRVILGSYPNTGNPGNSQRKPKETPTILSGNLPDGDGAKSNIIVRARTVDSTAVIDGLTITESYGYYYTSDIGAAYFVFNANPTLNNCIFKNNQSSAILNSNSSPKILNCSFENNISYDLGGGGTTNKNNSAPHFFNCKFSENSTYIASQTPYIGGAVLNSNSNPSFDSCLFLKNTANNFGGAMANLNSNPSIKNCIFKANNVTPAGYFGGNALDIYNDNSSPIVSNTLFADSNGCNFGGSIQNINNSNGIFKHCEFRNGNAQYGGGICANTNSSPVFESCIFYGAKASSGGAIYNLSQSNPTIINCIAANNSAAGEGSFMYNSNSSPKIINSTIVNNFFRSNGAGVISDNNASASIITNSILWGNILSNQSAELIGNSSANTILRNSITQSSGTNGVNGNFTGINPRLIDITNVAGPDKIFFTSDDGARLCNCSPVINKGLNVAANGFATDILSNPRIANGTIDMGAYEYQSAEVPASKTYYVNASAVGTNDGTSWTNAYKELKTATENTCADTIKIAMGIYKPALYGRDSSFFINRGVTILGGYENSGTPSDANRNIDLYPTVLSGDIGNVLDSTDNSYKIMEINSLDTNVTVDGIVFKSSNNDTEMGAWGSGITTLRGGAIYIPSHKKITINNCRFSNNYAFNGSGIYINGNNTVISKCVFSDNTATYGTLINNGPNNTIKNCIFYKNKASQNGGGVYESSGTFVNVVFYKNEAFKGAGVYMSNPVVKFINCDFIKNNTKSSTVGIGLFSSHNYSNEPVNPFLRNCIFQDNTVSNLSIGNQYSDWAYVKTSGQGLDYYDRFNIDYSATYSEAPYNNTHNISPTRVHFRNTENIIGPDSLWFTSDDGLLPDPCSESIDKGDNTSVTNILTDIAENKRIYGGTVDMGAYEYQGVFAPLNIIKASDSVICPGQSITFTAAPSNQGTNPGFQWKLNEGNVGTNSPNYTGSSFINGDKVQCILTSNSACVTIPTAVSNVITISVSSTLTATVTTNIPQTNICTGSSATFTATPTHAGNTPTFQWQVNGVNAGTNNSVFSSTGLHNNDSVKCVLTGTLSCAANTATSNIIIMKISPPINANAGNDTTICAGSEVTLQGSGGTTYSWSPSAGLSNPNIANPVAMPAAGTTYLLTVSNESHCKATDTIRINLNTKVNPAIDIAATKNITCSNESVLFTSTISNGGNDPKYQWQVNGYSVGDNSSTFKAENLNYNYSVNCILSSNSSCVSSATVASMAISISVIPITKPLVDISDHVLNITNPDADASYTWQVFNDTDWSDLFPAATGTTYTIDKSGKYRVKSVRQQCIAYSEESNASLRNPANNPYGIYIYPNPTSDILIIDELQISQQWQTLEIINQQGQRVIPKTNIRNKTSVTLHVDALRKGVYILKLISANGESTRFKFVRN